MEKIFKIGSLVVAYQPNTTTWHIGKVANYKMINVRSEDKFTTDDEDEVLEKRDSHRLNYQVQFFDGVVLWVSESKTDSFGSNIKKGRRVIFRVNSFASFEESKQEGLIDNINLINENLTIVIDSLGNKMTVPFENVAFYNGVVDNSYGISEETKILETNEVFIEKIEVKNLPFFADFEWKLQPNINVLLGENGFGKTNLMKIVASFLSNRISEVDNFFTPNSQFIIKFNNNITLRDNSLLYTLAIPSIRDLKKEKIEYSETPDVRDYPKGGTDNFIFHVPLHRLAINFLLNIASEYTHHRKSFDTPFFRLIEDVIGELTDNNFKFKRIENKTTTRLGERYNIFVETENGMELPIQQVSQGTMSILIILGLIYDFLKSLYPNQPEESLLKQYAIVFIDEIDAHLHPKWQRKIINILRKSFSNVQFILIAHNPLIVAGCYYGEVSVLRKSSEEENKFVLENLDKHFLGSDVDDIYAEAFGLYNLIDENYLKYKEESHDVEKLRLEVEKLKGKKTITPDEREKINDLFYIWQVMKVEEKRRKEAIDMGELKAKLALLRIENENLKQQLETKND